MSTIYYAFSLETKAFSMILKHIRIGKQDLGSSKSEKAFEEIANSLLFDQGFLKCGKNLDKSVKDELSSKGFSFIRSFKISISCT